MYAREEGGPPQHKMTFPERAPYITPFGASNREASACHGTPQR